MAVNCQQHAQQQRPTHPCPDARRLPSPAVTGIAGADTNTMPTPGPVSPLFSGLGFGGAPGEEKHTDAGQSMPRDDSPTGMRLSPKGDYDNNALARMKTRLDALLSLGDSAGKREGANAARLLDSGAYEDPTIEAGRRRQWVRYYVSQGRHGDALALGWDMQDPPDPRAEHMSDAERRGLWIRYFVASGLYEEALQVGWDEESPPDPRPRRIFVKSKGLYLPHNLYRRADRIAIEGYCDEAEITHRKICSKNRYEIQLHVTVAEGERRGEEKQIKIRCEKRDNLANLMATWAELKELKGRV